MRVRGAAQAAAQTEIMPPQPPTAGVIVAVAARPGLPYQHALDQCALLAWAARGRASVLTASPFFVPQLYGRLGPLARELIWTGGRPVPQPDEWGADIVAVPAQQVEAVIWADPARQGAAEHLGLAVRALAPGGSLLVIVAGPLARLAPRPPRGLVLAPAAALGVARLGRLLRGAGLAVEEVQGYGGAASACWGLAGATMERLGRGDLADRYLARQREELAVGGAQAALAPLAVVVARRRAEKDGAP